MEEELGIKKEITKAKIVILTNIESLVNEKIKHILSLFQKMVTEIYYRIVVEKNIINCFVASKYETNLQNLTNEIKFSIFNAFMRCRENNIVKIEFEDIFDDVLNNISNVSAYLPELNSIYLVLDNSSFFFIPNSECKALIILKNYHLNDNNTIYSHTSIKTFTVSPISLPSLLDIMNIADNPTSSLEDFKHFMNKENEIKNNTQLIK